MKEMVSVPHLERAEFTTEEEDGVELDGAREMVEILGRMVV